MPIDLKLIRLKLVETKYEKFLVKNIIRKYHSYVPTHRSVGRRLDWLVYEDMKIIGMIGVGSATYPPSKDMLTHLNINKEGYVKIFNTIGNNWRFCLKYSQKNLGTTILKLFRQEAKIEWKKKYDDSLEYIMTFIGNGKSGAVYKADNWKYVGETAGLPPHKSVSMKWDSAEKLKQKFVKPVGGDYKKLIFLIKL